MIRIVARFLGAAGILSALMTGHAAFGANVSPGKWGLTQVLGSDCVTWERREGFATCLEAATYFDQVHLTCNPQTMRANDGPAAACAGAQSNYVYLWYINPFGSPHVAGIAKSYCDEWDSNARGDLGLTANFNSTYGVHCPASNYSMVRNMGMPGYCPNCMQGNPVNPAIGNKYQVESDYIGQGPLPLTFARHYNSRLVEDKAGRIGPNWSHTYTRKLFYDASSANPVVVGARREDGKEIPFNLVGGVYVRDPTFVERLARVAGAWKLTNARDEVETYNNSGRLTSITNRSGLAQTLGYDAQGRLTSVTDAFGRALSFSYDSSSRIQTMTVPGGLVYQYAYTVNSFSNLFRVTHPDSTTRIYHYENTTFPSHLTGITDENGQRFSTYAYTNVEGKGFATSTQHAGSAEKVTLAFTGPLANATRNVTVTRHVSSSLSTSRNHTFQSVEGSARNTGIASPACVECGPPNRTYDASGNVSAMSNWRGFRTRYDSYDLARNLETKRTEGLASDNSVIPNVTRTITTQWHPDYRLQTGVAEPFRITTMVYGAATDPNPGNRGSLLSRTPQATTDADGALGFGATVTGTPRTWTYTYNANGQVLTMDGPRMDVTDVTTYSYYANNAICPGANAIGCRGQVETLTNAEGHVTQITEYNVHGQPLTIVDPNGLIATLAYDQRQRLTSRNAGGESTTYAYDNAGQLTRVTLPDGSFLQYTYDAAHRLTQIADNLGNRVTYTLDFAGNRTQEQVFDSLNQLAQTRSRVYNSLNRMIQEIGAAGQTTTFSYNNHAQVLTVDGPLPGTVDVTTNTYDALDRLTRVTDPNSGQVNYGYNRLDQLTSVSDPRGLVTSYAYDGLNNLNQQGSPDTGTTVNTYDTAGNLLTETDAKGQVTAYTYDALNRVTSITYQGGVVHNYQYDQGVNGRGRLTQITEPISTTHYAYDLKGRLTTETRTINAVVYATTYSYDTAGRMTGITYPSGRQVTYALDARGRVVSATTTKGVTANAVVSSVAYRPFGPVQSFTFGNGQTYARGFDQDGRISSYTAAFQSIAVGYDAASRINALTDTGNAANTNIYGYDTRDRLTSYAGPGASQAFTYDAVGNRVTKTVGAATDTYTYPSNSNRLSQIAGGANRAYAYDPNGSTIGDSVNSYAYDTRGRMVQAVSAAGTTSYQVNSLGQRIRKTNLQGDTVYHYDQQGRLIAESSSGGQALKEYIYLGDIPVAVLQ